MSNEVKTKEKVDMDPKYIIKLTVTLFLTCMVVAGILGWVNSITKDKIAAITWEKTVAAMQQVITADDFSDAMELTDDMTAAAAAQGGTLDAVYEAQSGGQVVGYAINVEASGSQGIISMMVGIDTDGTVTGVSIVTNAETSGIGSKVMGNEPLANGTGVLDQFIGKSAADGTLAVGTNVDAITGASNFDICEYIILQLIHEYRDSNTVIAMLCKTSVARNVFMELKRNGISFSACDILEFDAAKVFGITASACVLVVVLSENAVSPEICNVYDFENPEVIQSKFGYKNGQFCNNLGVDAEDFDGQCCFEWRQGVKHDCAKVMELTVKNGTFQNGQKEEVQIEDALVFPLVKSSMFKAPVIDHFSKYVIVTQKKAREETEHLAWELPKTWKYLNDNIESFENRKSVIYRGAPPFSMFGVGNYSYAKYKVGVSGFYKQPLFSLLYSGDGKPVMTDDTSYFICFEQYDMAYVAMLLLNSAKVQEFLTRIAFLDAKRPYTKKVLERIDFEKIVEALTMDELMETEKALSLPHYATTPMYDAFKASLGLRQLRFA